MHVRAAARDAVECVRDQVDLENRMERAPIAMVAAAAGVGYVLGGGLFTPFTARVLGLGLRVGLRLVVMPLLAERLVGFAQGDVAPETPVGTHARKSRSSNGNGKHRGLRDELKE